MTPTFHKATRTRSRLRLALIGPAGSGKTYTALRIAKGLGDKIALIDTERGSASKYSGDLLDFDVLELETFAPKTYVEAIHAAEAAGYEVLVIDSLSHAWAGKGGALEMVDQAAKRSRSGNSFAAWREVTPEHNALVDAILGARLHVIATMRTKTEYVVEAVAGKRTPKKVGLAPIQRDGAEYEFDVVGDLNLDHELVVSKTRCSALDGAVIRRPGEDVAEVLKRWLTDGAPVADAPRITALQLCQDIAAAKTLTELADARARANQHRAALNETDREAVKDELAYADKRLAAEQAPKTTTTDDGGWLAPDAQHEATETNEGEGET
jgi:hypothetical protein